MNYYAENSNQQAQNNNNNSRGGGGGKKRGNFSNNSSRRDSRSDSPQVIFLRCGLQRPEATFSVNLTPWNKTEFYYIIQILESSDC